MFACLLAAAPASAQVVGEAANAGSGSNAAGAVVGQVPGAMSAPALTPSASPGLQGSVFAAPSAPVPGKAGVIPALAASAIIPIDPAAMPAKKGDYSPSEWGKLVTDAKDEGTKAVLSARPGDKPADPQMTVKLNNGETVSGAFRGLSDGKMIFQTGGKFVGLKMDANNIEEVRRQTDVIFDGSGSYGHEEVVVHNRPAVADPFKDAARYKGRVVDIDTRDLDDLKWSAQTLSGRVIKADGNEILLESAKGQYHIQREFHRIDKMALRTDHYSSKGQIGSISEVAGKIPDGGPAEVVLMGGKTVKGRFFGVRKDAQGSFILMEVASGSGTAFRAFRDFSDLRTPGYVKGGLLADAETVYTNPEK